MVTRITEGLNKAYHTVADTRVGQLTGKALRTGLKAVAYVAAVGIPALSLDAISRTAKYSGVIGFKRPATILDSTAVAVQNYLPTAAVQVAQGVRDTVANHSKILVIAATIAVATALVLKYCTRKAPDRRSMEAVNFNLDSGKGFGSPVTIPTPTKTEAQNIPTPPMSIPTPTKTEAQNIPTPPRPPAPVKKAPKPPATEQSTPRPAADLLAEIQKGMALKKTPAPEKAPSPAAQEGESSSTFDPLAAIKAAVAQRGNMKKVETNAHKPASPKTSSTDVREPSELSFAQRQEHARRLSQVASPVTPSLSDLKNHAKAQVKKVFGPAAVTPEKTTPKHLLTPNPSLDND